MQTTVVMTLEKETKNTYKFSASTNAQTGIKPPFGEIYIQKQMFHGVQVPQQIKVTVEG